MRFPPCLATVVCTHDGQCSSIGRFLDQNLVIDIKHHLKGLTETVLAAVCHNYVRVAPIWGTVHLLLHGLELFQEWTIPGSTE